MIPLNLCPAASRIEAAQTPKEKKQIEKYWHDMFKNQWGGPGLHDLMKELRAVLDEYDGDRCWSARMTTSTTWANGDDELHLVFNFPLMRTERITPSHIRSNQKERLTGWMHFRFGAGPATLLATTTAPASTPAMGTDSTTPNWRACTPRWC
jgi:hypothetical protein